MTRFKGGVRFPACLLNGVSYVRRIWKRLIVRSLPGDLGSLVEFVQGDGQ